MYFRVFLHIFSSKTPFLSLFLDITIITQESKKCNRYSSIFYYFFKKIMFHVKHFGVFGRFLFHVKHYVEIYRCVSRETLFLELCVFNLSIIAQTFQHSTNQLFKIVSRETKAGASPNKANQYVFSYNNAIPKKQSANLQNKYQ